MTYEKKLKEIGKKIKQLRIEAGYTSYENFAIDNDLHRMTVYRAEAGKSLSLRTLILILEKLDISLGEFFEGI